MATTSSKRNKAFETARETVLLGVRRQQNSSKNKKAEQPWTFTGLSFRSSGYLIRKRPTGNYSIRVIQQNYDTVFSLAYRFGWF